MITKEQIKERLDKKTIIDSVTNCWLFIGAKSGDGHSQIEIYGRNYYVHRLSAFIFLDFDLTHLIEFQINHKLECPNKNCWNPDHIYIGTQSENILDTFKKGRQPSRGNTGHIRKYCPQGHPYSEENTYEKVLPNGNLRRECRTCQREKLNQRRQRARENYKNNRQNKEI